MIRPRRRDLLLLVAVPLGAISARAAQSPAAGQPTLPPALKNEKEAAEAIVEIPAGAIPAVNSGPFEAMRWQMRYYFDQLGKRCHLQDFALPTPQFGLASLLIEESDADSLKSQLLVTRDNGKTWKLEKTEKNPLGVFVLGETTAWVVTAGHLLFSADAGVKWDKRPLPDSDSTQVWFSSPQTGWAFGGGKVFYRTDDAGRSWKTVPESEKLDLKSAETYLRSMAMMPSGVGMLAGDSTAAPQPASLPDWMTPDRAVRRKSVPGSTIVYETHDHGQTWAGHVSSAFGAIRRVRMAPGRAAAVFQYRDSFLWPAEAYDIDPRTGTSWSIFRRKELVVHDVALLDDGSVVVAAIQPAGRLRMSSPVPGKLRILWSPDHSAWFEMKVDYRAMGNEATLARCSDGSLWVATDEGAILQLAH